jgi:hypothetical protein
MEHEHTTIIRILAPCHDSAIRERICTLLALGLFTYYKQKEKLLIMFVQVSNQVMDIVACES